MALVRKAKEQGISLKTTSVVMLVATLLIAAMLFVASMRTFGSYQQMAEITDDYIRLQEAASELMSASDYLTEEVRCYTVTGDRKHMENYIAEADVVRRREHAVAVMGRELPDSPALADLLDGMAESLSLMDREYYAMRLMMEADGDTDMPEAVRKVTLSEADRALSPEEKRERARVMVHDAEYYEQKNRIRSNIADCISDLKDAAHGNQQELEEKARAKMFVVAGLILLQSIAAILVLWLIKHLGVNPLLREVSRVRQDGQTPAAGEAGTYNTMYNAYKKNVTDLSFKANHDELTGLYNRAGFDLIKTGLDLRSTALLLFDADRFKEINDRLGHAAGDAVLKKIAAVLKNNFRSEDYICRIGGDEFVVFMTRVAKEPEALIEHKIAQISGELSDTSDGIPAVTLSVGVTLGSKENRDPEEMLHQADAALYYVKEHGRNGCRFWQSQEDGAH